MTLESTGGHTQLKEYVRQVRPRPPVGPVVGFETPAGWQAQVDFANNAECKAGAALTRPQEADSGEERET